MKSLRIFLIVFMFVMGSAANLYAAGMDGQKIGYVDLSRLFDEYGKTKKYDKILEGEHNAYTSERENKLEKITEAQNKLALLNEAEKEKLQAQIDKDRADLLEFDRQQQTDLRKKRDEKLREILLEVEEVVREFSGKENYAMILNDRVLIHGSEDYDVTEQILKILNDNYKE